MTSKREWRWGDKVCTIAGRTLHIATGVGDRFGAGGAAPDWLAVVMGNE